MLKIEHLTKRFGGLAAVNNVSTLIETGKIKATLIKVHHSGFSNVIRR